MIDEEKSPNTLSIALWVTQGLLSVSFLCGAAMKLFQPVEQLSAMWPWTAEVPPAFLAFTGVVDLLGGVGIILPSLLRIKPWLTPVVAVAIVVQMVGASAFHVARGEASDIGANIVFALMALFIGWGRWKKAPVLPR
ncbi:DoxX family protein [Imperialibacter roseus]|uniref:DoxX family protein n=1 Tax=Imperialibacter roseus TaxID=1324217 RepID=A0ABZ0ISQ4_9BACT|nr:DoxX family protein [Imperialibacter roseus]WOK08072.1 DoxX family protein [Imperialibacter roseus]